MKKRVCFLLGLSLFLSVGVAFFESDDLEDIYAYLSDSYPYYLEDYDLSKYLVSERLLDVFGQENVKKEALKVIDMLRNAKTYKDLGAKLPNVITISGNRGTGRRLLARVIAGESGAYVVEGNSLPGLSTLEKLIFSGPIVVLADMEGDTFSVSLNDYVEFLKEHKPVDATNEVMLIRIKDGFNTLSQNDFFGFGWSDFDNYGKESDDIREKVIYVPQLDRCAREGLLKKFSADVKISNDLISGDAFKKLSSKMSNFNAYDIKDLVNKAAIIAGEQASLHRVPTDRIDEKHFYQAYLDVSKDIQSGKGGGSFYIESFHYTYSEETRFSDVLGIDYVIREVSEYVDILLNGGRYENIGVKPPRGLLLEGLPGVGKTLLAKAVAGEADCCFISTSGAQFINGYVGGGPESVRALFSFARNVSGGKPVIIFIDEFDSLGKRPEASDSISNEYANTINEFLKQMDGFEASDNILVIAATNNAHKLDPALVREGRFDRKVYVPLPDEVGRQKILLHYIEQVVCDVDIDKTTFVKKLAKQCRGFNGAGLRALVNEAAILALRSDFDFVKEEHFFEACKKIAPSAQNGVGGDNEEGFSYTFSEETTFDNVIGMKEVIREADEFVDVLLNSEKYNEMGVDRLKGMLLHGPPGTGKTLLARAIAGESGCCFISVSASQFVKLYVGSGPAKIRKLFDFARKMSQNKPVIIFLDEIDALGRRDDPHIGAERRNTINELLTKMDGFSQDEKIVVIGATNHLDLVDRALLRDGRFDKKIEIPLPSVEDRELILLHYLKKIKKLDPALSMSEVAKKYAREMKGQSGASLESFVKKAGLNAVHNNDSYVSRDHFEEAFLNTVLGLKSNVKQTAKELEVTAYHEAGHALMAVLCGNEISRVSILARASALGVVFHDNEKELFSNNNKIDLLNFILIALGGICAENLIYGNSTPGTASDLDYSNELAHRMVCRYGMADGDLRGATSSYVLSDITKKKFDDAAFAIVRKCMRVTESVLRENKEKLCALTKVLLKKETLLMDEVYKIIGRPRNVVNKFFGEKL